MVARRPERRVEDEVDPVKERILGGNLVELPGIGADDPRR
jgi:hypothetical protein